MLHIDGVLQHVAFRSWLLLLPTSTSCLACFSSFFTGLPAPFSSHSLPPSGSILRVADGLGLLIQMQILQFLFKALQRFLLSLRVKGKIFRFDHRLWKLTPNPSSPNLTCLPDSASYQCPLALFSLQHIWHTSPQGSTFVWHTLPPVSPWLTTSLPSNLCSSTAL